MTTQPEALRLADELDAIVKDGADPDLVYEAAAELRRLHAQRDALLEALQNLVSVCQRMDLEHQAERPSEAEYQTAMQAAQDPIYAVKGGA